MIVWLEYSILPVNAVRGAKDIQHELLERMKNNPVDQEWDISQGVWDGVQEGSPAEPNTGSLVRVNADGTFTVVTDGLDRPTSLEFINNTAYIITLTGEIWTIADVTCPPFF